MATVMLAPFAARALKVLWSNAPSAASVVIMSVATPFTTWPSPGPGETAEMSVSPTTFLYGVAVTPPVTPVCTGGPGR